MMTKKNVRKLYFLFKHSNRIIELLESEHDLNSNERKRQTYSLEEKFISTLNKI